MPYRFDRLTMTHPDLAQQGEAMRRRLATLERAEAPRLRRYWAYYRNAMSPARSGDAGRPYRQAQEWGLPPRITGELGGGGAARKEVVIENDIAWRVDAIVDFLFGRGVTIRSAAPDAGRRARIEQLLRRIVSGNGGVAFLQRVALLGAVYGHVDVLVKYVPLAKVDDACHADVDAQSLGAPAPAGDAVADDAPEAEASMRTQQTRQGDAQGADGLLSGAIRFEIVEPTRAVPLLSPLDASSIAAYAQSFTLPRDGRTGSAAACDRSASWLDALRQALRKPGTVAGDGASADVRVLEVITPTQWQRYEDERLIAEGSNALGRVPLVHVQNAALPFEYAGAGEVEPMMPLQDELNARLSDRAYRITMQSARMYLGKQIDGFSELPIGPGRMYATDNPDAEILEFGGDAACPSEADHIAELRDALDKTSGVSPVAAGAIRNRIGNLTSAAALRVTFSALLSRTERKRTIYGSAIAQLCELSLAWLDRAGVFPNAPGERRIELDWPDPLPIGDAR